MWIFYENHLELYGSPVEHYRTLSADGSGYGFAKSVVALLPRDHFATFCGGLAPQALIWTGKTP
jgi:hypothetical protein